MNNTCSNCIYSTKAADTSQTALNLRTVQLGCRRFPPVVHAIPTPQGVAMMTNLPMVKADGWCGEHEPDLTKLEGRI